MSRSLDRAIYVTQSGLRNVDEQFGLHCCVTQFGLSSVGSPFLFFKTLKNSGVDGIFIYFLK